MSNLIVICFKCKNEVKENDCIFDEYREVYLCHECLEKYNKEQKDIGDWL